MLNNTKEFESNLDYSDISNVLENASKKIAPLWPLESFVAVNPYLGLSNQSFEAVANKLSFMADIQTTMPAEYYLNAIEDKNYCKMIFKEFLIIEGFTKKLKLLLMNLN